MEKTMLATVWDGGSAPVLTRRPVPQLCGPGDAIVRVTRSAICTSDLHILHGALPRAVPGIVLGHEFAGRVKPLARGWKNCVPATGWPPTARASAAAAGFARGDM